jgi:branched-chain amino acid transport system ATP-binding protein
MLSINNIDVVLGGSQILRKVSLSVDEGEIVALIGSNGAGKTTLLRTISGLIHPISGMIEFQGTRIDVWPPHKIVRLGISHVPERRGIFPDMTVLENLELGAYTSEARKNRRKTLKWVFEIFPILEERKFQRAKTLSGGEQQMLVIARGLMSRPKLLILDEPSLGLAPILVDKLFKIIKDDLNSNGISILLAEQNVAKALAIAHRAYVMENGKIVLEGKAKDVLHNPHVEAAYLGL